MTRPVLAVRDGAEITVTGGEELAIGSNAEQEGLLLLEDGTLTCPALWLQNGMKYDTDAYIDHLGHLLDGNIRRALERSYQDSGQA